MQITPHIAESIALVSLSESAKLLLRDKSVICKLERALSVLESCVFSAVHCEFDIVLCSIFDMQMLSSSLVW